MGDWSGAFNEATEEDARDSEENSKQLVPNPRSMQAKFCVVIPAGSYPTPFFRLSIFTYNRS